MTEDLIESEQVSTAVSEEDTMKILVATDIHLGYGEKDPTIREFLFLKVMDLL
jgi:hypothetical protein